MRAQKSVENGIAHGPLRQANDLVLIESLPFYFYDVDGFALGALKCVLHIAILLD
jgi:hypothetical protein